MTDSQVMLTNIKLTSPGDMLLCQTDSELVKGKKKNIVIYSLSKRKKHHAVKVILRDDLW